MFIDGTKIEANANRYTFVWRGSINYHLAGLLDSIDKLYSSYNSFIKDNGFGEKYELGNAQMFVIDGIDKVRDVIEKDRKRKITKHKKLSNNRIIEIDNCSPIEILKLQKNLMTIADGEGIAFVNGKGKRKQKLQQLYEELEHCGQRLMHYKECFEIIWKDRNSYIKLYDHEKRKTRAYSKDIGKYYNMKTMVFEDEQVYICHDGRELRHISTEKKE